MGGAWLQGQTLCRRPAEHSAVKPGGAGWAVCGCRDKLFAADLYRTVLGGIADMSGDGTRARSMAGTRRMSSCHRRRLLAPLRARGTRFKSDERFMPHGRSMSHACSTPEAAARAAVCAGGFELPPPAPSALERTQSARRGPPVGDVTGLVRALHVTLRFLTSVFSAGGHRHANAKIKTVWPYRLAKNAAPVQRRTIVTL